MEFTARELNVIVNTLTESAPIGPENFWGFTIKDRQDLATDILKLTPGQETLFSFASLLIISNILRKSTSVANPDGRTWSFSEAEREELAFKILNSGITIPVKIL